mgnify:CR=1 FL=1
MILEYKLDIDFDGKLRTPAWISCGGFFKNSSNTLVGFNPSNVEYKVPDNVVVLSVAQLKTRVLGLHSITPYLDDEGEALDNASVESMVDDILSKNDFS